MCYTYYKCCNIKFVKNTSFVSGRVCATKFVLSVFSFLFLRRFNIKQVPTILCRWSLTTILVLMEIRFTSVTAESSLPRSLTLCAKMIKKKIDEHYNKACWRAGEHASMFHVNFIILTTVLRVGNRLQKR